MNAEIISVGTELLLGDILNSNAQFLSKELALLGISVYRQSVVGDNFERLFEAFDDAVKRGANLIITTGGLGPTEDDLTKEAAAKYMNKELLLNEEILNWINEFLSKQGLAKPDNNKKQALIPEGAIILHNDRGTAPGCIIENEGKIIITLPGPPQEMIPMFSNHVKPYLKNLQDQTLVSRVIKLCGIGESTVENIINDIMQSKNPTVAPYAKTCEVHLRITANASNENEAYKLMEPVANEIYSRLGDNIYGEDDTTLEEAIANLLTEKKMLLATAESCTGGMLASRLVDYSGISKVFKEGCVSYSNESKIRCLGVREETLNNFGAVSHETAAEMALGIAQIAGTNVGLSTTGIAGPDGGTDDKPVGLVYIGLFINGEVKTKEIRIVGNRERVRIRTVVFALDWLRRELKYI